MTREEQLEFCKLCKNRSFNPNIGIICGLTAAPATFIGTCPDYLEDARERENHNTLQASIKQESTRNVNKGRYVLLALGGLFVFLGFYEGMIMPDAILLAGFIDWFIAAVFFGLGVLSFYRASLAMIIGLSFYVLLVILLAVFDPTTLVQGVIWKVIIVSLLGYGIVTAREQEKANAKVKSTDLLDQI